MLKLNVSSHRLFLLLRSGLFVLTLCSWQTDVRGATPTVAASGASGEGSSSSAVRRRRSTPAPPRSTNDQRIITYLKNKVVELEASLKRAELELQRSKSHPTAGFSQREDFLLGEIYLISRQLPGLYILWLAFFIGTCLL